MQKNTALSNFQLLLQLLDADLDIDLDQDLRDLDLDLLELLLLEYDGVGLGGQRLYGTGRLRALVIRRRSRKLGDPLRRGIDGDRVLRDRDRQLDDRDRDRREEDDE